MRKGERRAHIYGKNGQSKIIGLKENIHISFIAGQDLEESLRTGKPQAPLPWQHHEGMGRHSRLEV